jgi:hypothetical protein
MKNSPYHFEIKDLMIQFVSAFDDIIIERYNKSRAVEDKIKIRYVYAPKERVIHDMVNKARHITLPVVAVSIAGISRDQTRVFNKIAGSYHQGTEYMETLNANVPVSNYIPQPVPVNVQVKMSILTKFQTDMDQILSNFIPHNDPYIIISWKIPSDFVTTEQEIRSEVLWDGNLGMSYPTDLPSTTPYRISADTSFTIKGWLFKEKQLSVGNIYSIDSFFTPINILEGIDELVTETASVSLSSAK